MQTGRYPEVGTDLELTPSLSLRTLSFDSESGEVVSPVSAESQEESLTGTGKS